VIVDSYREGIQKEAVVAAFKATLTNSWHLPGDAVENQEKLQLAKPMGLEKLEADISNTRKKLQTRS